MANRGSIAIALLLLSASPTWTQDAPDDFVVEKLTAEEISLLHEADKRLTVEQLRYQMEVSKVRFAHGQSAGGYYACNALLSNVELKGGYALITKHRDTSSCPIAATGQTTSRP